jgi:predicted dehydrogenase
VQTDGGSMFIAGVTGITEPPYNDVWTIPGEEKMVDVWKAEITEKFQKVDATKHYHQLMIADFIDAIASDRDPLITAESGRVTVEIFTAIYRSNRDRTPIKFPLQAEADNATMDGRVVARISGR